MSEETGREDAGDPRLAALILAGGESSRMGRPKAWLEWRGRPLLAHLAAIFADAGAGTIVVVGAPGQELPPLPSSAIRVDDPPGERGGPLVGLLVGLEAAARAGADAAFLAACDGVFLSRAHLDFLRAELEGEGGLEAVIPIDAARGPGGRRFAHPLASLVRVAPALRAARALIAGGQRRPIALFDALETRWIPSDALPDPRALRTCNTPDEYAAAREEDAASGPP
ncbi:MAG: NTP transferase domain-containing protein [Myxococcales bacterium]|nr:NTP transferase domain-containing protein [Myxococcales bacterium]MCB9706618.1 NTP transferase domain-containing protein [Myxococcales bacterium]